MENVYEERLDAQNLYEKIFDMLIKHYPFEVGRFTISWKIEHLSPYVFDKKNYPYLIGVIHDRMQNFDDTYFEGNATAKTIDFVFKFLWFNSKNTTVKMYFPKTKEDVEELILHKHPFKIEKLPTIWIAYYNERDFMSPDKKYEKGAVIYQDSMDEIPFRTNDYSYISKLTNHLNGYLD